MGIFDWLFKKKKVIPPKGKAIQSSTQTVEVSKPFLSVSSSGYAGLYSLSKSRKWAISWRDSDPASGRGGHREGGYGDYILADLVGDVVSAQGQMQRPNNGSVADNGSFCLEDWHLGSSLSGTFNVFDYSGNSIVSKELTANIFGSGISKNGKLAYCATANSKSEHGYKVILFDLETGKELFCVTPRTQGLETYIFDEEKKLLIADVKGVGKFRYDSTGDFVDGNNLGKANLESSDYSRIIRAAEKILGEQDISNKRASEALEAVMRARSLGADSNPAWKPNALKVQGFAHEILGQAHQAIEVYEEAINLNPKIGVKRRLDALKKRVG
ncbi:MULTISPECIES: tetratricopeptide repeat protein [unclassified Pseudomonas]|uniref:tetratricopeptide repeat protein n=1 Tax=unclassified Pseudomonas TaxID=196821 RepID=UPI0030D7A989